MVSGEDPFPVCRWHPLAHPHVEGGAGSARGPRIRTRVPPWGFPLSWPPRLPRAPPADTVAVGVGFQQMNFGDTNI